MHGKQFFFGRILSPKKKFYSKKKLSFLGLYLVQSSWYDVYIFLLTTHGHEIKFDATQ